MFSVPSRFGHFGKHHPLQGRTDIPEMDDLIGEVLDRVGPLVSGIRLWSRQDGGDTSVSQAAGLPVGNAEFTFELTPFGLVS